MPLGEPSGLLQIGRNFNRGDFKSTSKAVTENLIVLGSLSVFGLLGISTTRSILRKPSTHCTVKLGGI